MSLKVVNRGSSRSSFPSRVRECEKQLCKQKSFDMHFRVQPSAFMI
jgi:hypothetical protein